MDKSGKGFPYNIGLKIKASTQSLKKSLETYFDLEKFTDKAIGELSTKEKLQFAMCMAYKYHSYCLIGGIVLAGLMTACIMKYTTVKAENAKTQQAMVIEETITESTTNGETKGAVTKAVASIAQAKKEATTEVTTAVVCHFNKDGKLYGQKGIFSGLWPQLESIAKSSNQQYIKDLMVYVGDNTELSKSHYEEDKFTAINGYGTVHWNQSGHRWPNKYSVNYNGIGIVTIDKIFNTIQKTEKLEEPEKKVVNGVSVLDTDVVTSGGSVEATTEPKQEVATRVVNEQQMETATRIVTTTNLPAGKVWGSNSCGVCSLAMALSTLSGVTVSPPEVAIAANLLIGPNAWYDTILFSKSQAQLAQMAGFPVDMEPYTEAKQSTMDACLNANGVAIFVSNQPDWVAGNGRHYIMVRNKVGDKYYTADSGKNPIGGYTYEQLSAGYNQQNIVYIYPKTAKVQNK